MGGGSRGGFGGGGYVGGSRGGFVGGGYSHGGYYGGYRGGYYRNGFFYGGYYPYGYGFGYGYPYLGLGFGLGYWPDYYGYPYDYGYGYPYSYPYDGYASYQTSPNVTVVYPTQAAPTVIAPDRANPVTREYDQYGQEVRPGGATAGSPVYLIAFTDHTIRAASAYWVDGQMLHYVTLEHEERQVPLSMVDRSLSSQLNRERRVPFQLPAQ